MDVNEEIVISGIAGRFPECNSVEELAEGLLKGVDLVTDGERRFPPGIKDVPPRCGALPELDRFDSTFFGIHAKQAEYMDPRQRILCETVYEAIIDAGYNPQELRGSKTGVYVAMSMFSNPESLREREDSDGYTNIGLSLGLAANRISYCFDFTGKSYTLETACSSSVYGFVNAVDDIASGKIEAALVCTGHVIFHPHGTQEFNKLNMLSPDGKCKVFSTLRDGYVRGEAIASFLLQKRSASRRVYATVVGALSNADGYKMEGITFPSWETQLQLLDQVYAGRKVTPDEVTYVEAHGTGTPAGDEQELLAIASKFCRNRTAPILVGAVKSNIGHAETASGLCSIAKVLIAMERGVIPANLHVDPLDVDLPGIKDGKIKIVTENLPWNGGVAAVNSFGFGGANAHVALKSNPKEKSRNYVKPKYRLVQVSGRTEEAVNHFLDEIEKNQDDEEFLALVDEIHKMNCKGHNFRGYTILGDKPKREVARYTNARPIWLIYTGMGAQWLGMGRDLMRDKVFRNTIKRCADALKPYNIDLEEILTADSPTTFDNCTHCFTSIAAVEIAMTDLLYSMGIIPDGIAGHSLGEVGCSYADGQIRPEEAILLAYARGYASQATKLPAGAMAAVGLSKEECLKILPDDICIACQNGKHSVTISGPKDATFQFVDGLSSRGIFARVVNTGGLAYHSKYVRDAAPYLYDFVKKVLKNPTIRSSRWVSTSVNETQLNEPWTKYNCAEYHRNNFCSTVLFDEIYKHMPENAIVVEVAPHGLMQAILKRELNSGTSILSLANRNSPDNEEFFLSSIGKIYLAGGQPNLRNLYNNVSYPVSRGTKMISSMVRWDHSVSWLVPLWKHKDSFGQIINVNVSNEKHAYLGGHNIDGRVLMPATGYLELAWRTLAQLHLQEMEDLPVVIENVRFKRATVLPPMTDVQFLVTIMKQSGNFEIFEGGTVVCSGTIYTMKDLSSAYSNAKCPDIAKDEYLPLTSQDLYKECRLRGYMYEGSFQGITQCDSQGLRGRIKWQGDFTSFMDAMLHMTIISETKRDLELPIEIKRVVVDPQEHLKQVTEGEDIPIFHNTYMKAVRSGGIEIRGLLSTKAPRRKQMEGNTALETYEFIPYETSSGDESDLDIWLYAAVQIILQNIRGFTKTLKICEFLENNSNKLKESVKKILESQPLVDAEYIVYNKNETATFDAVLLTENALEDNDVNAIRGRLNQDSMILYRGNFSKLTIENVNVIYKATAGQSGIYLLRPNEEIPVKHRAISVKNSEFGWLEEVKSLVRDRSNEVIYLISKNEEFSGLVGLVKCLLAEPLSAKFRCFLIEDKRAEVFSLDNDFYRRQLRKNVTFNVLRNGRWGTFAHLPLKPIQNKEVMDASVAIQTPGDLSSLSWIEKSPFYIKCDQESENVYVYYSSLNFKDVMVATGKLHVPQADKPTVPESYIGLEYAGITSSGRRVMGTVEYDGYSLQLQSDPGFTWEVPKEWSLHEAATVPTVYATCYYALIVRGRMQPGESILIHAGTGGVGMAAISIALSMGCKVFTTVGSREKRDYLKKLYPQIKDENIGDSRSASFVNMIVEHTKGRGVDLVLNSLAADLFKASLNCVAPMGRFLEIGKVDLTNNTLVETRMLLENCSIHGIFLDKLMGVQLNVKREIYSLLAEGIKSGAVKPLPVTVFKEHEVEDAFRFLASGKHKGKVLIEIRKENGDILRPPVRTISAIPKVYFHPNKSYILVGGLGGIGLELTDWLIRRGATKIVLNSRRQISNGYQSYCLKRWSKWNGISVKINTDETATLEGAKNLVTLANRLGQVGGVFNMALVLRDGLIENQTEDMYEAVLRPKIVSGLNMDTVTRTQCPELDHFVVFSSVTCGRGNSGQTNYGMANSALEQLCEKRKSENLPALAVQWGAIGDVGALVKTNLINKLADQMVAQNINSCLEVLEQFMLQDSPIGSSIVIASKTASKSRDVIKTAAEAVAHILGIRNLGLIDKTLTLAQLGLDSLMAAEIKQTLYRNYQLEFNTDELRDITFDKLMATSQTDENNNIATKENGIDSEITENCPAMLSKDSIVALNRPQNDSRPTFMIHNLQGHVESLRAIGERLKSVAYGVQCTEEADFESIRDYAKYFIKQIKTKQPRGPYSLCGYSYGGALAMEMGFQLEKSGELVDMILLDGSPAFVNKVLKDFFEQQEKCTAKGKTKLLVNFASHFSTEVKHKVAESLDPTMDWQKQLQLLGEVVSRDTGLDAEHVAVSADRYFKRTLAGFTYQPQDIFGGKVLLIRADNSHMSSSEDYDLHKVCKREVEVVKLRGDHNTILLGENSKIIAEKMSEFF